MAIVPTTDNTYTGDGTTTQFTITFEYLQAADVYVTVNEVNTAFTFATPGIVNISPAPLSGTTVRVFRSTDATTVPYEFEDGVPFLTRLADFNWKALLFAFQESWAEFRNNAGNFLKTLRSNTNLNVIPDLRANKLLGFDATGQPIAVDADPASVPDLDIRLTAAESNINERVQQIASVAALSTVTAVVGRVYVLKEYNVGTGVGGGSLVGIPSGTVDNGIIFAGAGGTRFKRINYQRIILEFFGVTGSGDEGVLIQNAIEYCRARGLSLYGNNSYTSSITLTVEEYATTPPVFMQLNKSEISINQLTYTGTANAAIWAKSAQTKVIVRRLIGPGTGTTSGLKVYGLGDPHHSIGWVSGFTNNIDLDEAFGQTVYVGWSDNAIRGVRINASNDCRIKGGRIGGPFVTSLNPASCEIGIDIISGAGNSIECNVEYCRRSINSIGIRDNGTGTQFNGYTESCSAFNIQANGRDSVFNVIAGGTNMQESSKYFAGFSNRIELKSQIDAGQELVSGANSTLTNMLLQAFQAESSGVISGPRGFSTLPRATDNASNLLLDSSNFQGGSWGAGVLGTASWGAVTISSTADVYTAGGYRTGTKFVIPALPNDDDIYRISQSGINIPAGIHTYGLWARCESGDIDVMVRVIYDTTYQFRSMTRLTASDGFVRISSEELSNRATDANATYEISFRTKTGATLTLFNAHMLNAYPAPLPADNGATVRPIIGGDPVDGNMFTNGIRINGMIQNSISPIISAATTLSANNIRYKTYIVTGGAAKNILLEPGAHGCGIVLKRDGVAGTVNVLPSATTIDGATSSVSITTAWATLRLEYDDTLGWLTI